MSGEKQAEDGKARWLENEPATWDEMNRALQDVSILLRYLGELPDARLLGCFKDTTTKLSDAAGRRCVPPCDDYAVFLRRLFQISAAFQTGNAQLLPDEDKGKDETGCGSAVAFVYWSRDFLACVAAPATAESIRLTHDFLVNRASPLNPFRGKQDRASKRLDLPASPPDPSAPTRNRLARKLATRVFVYEGMTIGVALLTVVVSIYALSGRLILSNEQAMQESWDKLDARIEMEEEKLFEPVRLPISGEARAHFEVTGLCEMTREAPPARAEVADSGRVTSDATPAAETAAAPKLAYALPAQAHLCADRAKALLNLFVVTMHLQSWSSAITETAGRTLAYPFGVNPVTLHNFAREDGNCFGLRPTGVKFQTSAACEQVLWDELDRSRHVAESILGAVTQYLLPVLYGFLGAMAAALRSLRRKVEASLLSYTDRPRLQQGAILGVLCGAVIGLFAAVLGGAGGAGNIGISALALLAGYNVDGVFRFLDELSDRLFKPADPAKSG